MIAAFVSTSPTIYALLVGESELAARCRRSNSRTTLGEFLLRLEMELKAQHSIVSGIVRRVGGSASRTKETAAWLAEKVGRLKLNGTLLTYSGLSRVVELEALAAGSQMRVYLWETLEEVAKRDTRLEGISCSFFLEQAQAAPRRDQLPAASSFIGRICKWTVSVSHGSCRLRMDSLSVETNSLTDKDVRRTLAAAGGLAYEVMSTIWPRPRGRGRTPIRRRAYARHLPESGLG